MDNEQENYRKKIYNDFYNDKLNIMELFVFLFSFNCTNKYDSEDYYKIQDDLDFLKKFYSDVKDNSKYDLNFIMHGPDSKIEYPPYVKDNLTKEEMETHTNIYINFLNSEKDPSYLYLSLITDGVMTKNDYIEYLRLLNSEEKISNKKQKCKIIEFKKKNDKKNEE